MTCLLPPDINSFMRKSTANQWTGFNDRNLRHESIIGLNLCLRKWLSPSHLIPFRMKQLKVLFEEGCMKFKRFFSKTNKVSKLQIIKSSLFFSRIVKEEKEFLENICLVALYWGISCELFVWVLLDDGIRLNKYSPVPNNRGES